MLNKITRFTATSFLLFGMMGSVNAEEKKAVEIDYIAEAQPYLHLSCEGLVNAFDGDEKKIEKAIGLMAAVSLINRKMDYKKLVPTEKAQEEFEEFMKKALTKQCEDDVQSLMVTNVDRAIAYAFSERPEKKK